MNDDFQCNSGTCGSFNVQGCLPCLWLLTTCVLRSFDGQQTRLKKTKLGWTCDLVLFHRISCQGQNSLYCGRSFHWSLPSSSGWRAGKNSASYLYRCPSDCVCLFGVDDFGAFQPKWRTMRGIAVEFKPILAFAVNSKFSIFREQFSWSHKQWWWKS